MKRGLAWSVAATVFGAIGGLIVTPALVTHLGAGDFGAYLLILALT
jgi:O-antigen/teichoic acid export membrane protein